MINNPVNFSYSEAIISSTLASTKEFNLTNKLNYSEFIPTESLKLVDRRFSHLEQGNSSIYDKERIYVACFQSGIRHLYNTFADMKGDISLLVQNAGDGFGDHAHGVSVANQILQDFPNATVKLHTFFHQNLDKLPPLAVPNSNRASCYFSSEFFPENNEDTTELKKNIYQSACVMDISSDTGRTDLGLDEIRKSPKYTYLREYGCKHTIDSDPSHNLSMGLNDLEEGIFIKDIPDRPLELLKDDRIKNILFETTNPTTEILENYRKEHHLHLFYHKLDCFYQASDIYIAAELHKNDKMTIDILIPIESSLNWLSHWNILDKQILESFGIGQVRLIKKDSEELLEIDPSGKELRIIHPGFLPQEDFYTLLSNCDEPFGATGDHTFTDGQSKGLVLNYELRNVKGNHFLSWIKLTEKLECPLVNSYLHEIKNIYNPKTETFSDKIINQRLDYDNYVNNFINEVAKNAPRSSHAIVQLIQNPEFKNQWTRVNDYIRQNCDIKYNIKAIVSRHLAFHHFPGLAKLEEECYSAFRKGEKNIRDLNREISFAIEKCKADISV